MTAKLFNLGGQELRLLSFLLLPAALAVAAVVYVVRVVLAGTFLSCGRFYSRGARFCSGCGRPVSGP